MDPCASLGPIVERDRDAIRRSKHFSSYPHLRAYKILDHSFLWSVQLHQTRDDLLALRPDGVSKTMRSRLVPSSTGTQDDNTATTRWLFQPIYSSLYIYIYIYIYIRPHPTLNATTKHSILKKLKIMMFCRRRQNFDRKPEN